MSDMSASRVPQLCYGTACKKDQTRALVRQALKAGFRGVDTAAQPKHYQEHLVGEGIRDAIREGIVTRDNIYIQTKYTSIHGQDPGRMPYDSRLSISDQVAASVASSINHLRSADDELSESCIDCLLLHSPFPNIEQTQEAWRAMERCVPNQVRTLGISNIYSLSVLEAFYAFTKVQPSVVQNRFYPGTQYDSSIRKFCREKGIVYQSFWTLTANPGLLKSGPVKEVAHKVGVSGAVALYALVLGLGENMSVLDGTTNAGRMDEDLRGVEVVMEWAGKDPEAWKRVVSEFKQLVDRQSS